MAQAKNKKSKTKKASGTESRARQKAREIQEKRRADKRVVDEIWAIITIAIGIFFAVSIFTSDPALHDLASKGLRMMNLAFPIIGFQMVTTNLFQCLGMVRKSIFLSLSRQLLFLPDDGVAHLCTVFIHGGQDDLPAEKAYTEEDQGSGQHKRKQDGNDLLHETTAPLIATLMISSRRGPKRITANAIAARNGSANSSGSSHLPFPRFLRSVLTLSRSLPSSVTPALGIVLHRRFTPQLQQPVAQFRGAFEFQFLRRAVQRCRLCVADP